MRFRVRHVATAALLAAAVVGPALAAEVNRFVSWRGPATPALALKDLAGQPRTLADYRGRVVLVNFWATWCEPCKDEMPSIVKLRETLAGRPFDVVTVNFGESRPKVTKFLEANRLELPVLLDPNQEAPKAWQVRVLPSSFLVDADGRVRYTVVGEIDWASAAAVTTVRSLLPAS